MLLSIVTFHMVNVKRVVLRPPIVILVIFIVSDVTDSQFVVKVDRLFFLQTRK